MLPINMSKIVSLICSLSIYMPFFLLKLTIDEMFIVTILAVLFGIGAAMNYGSRLAQSKR